MKTFWEEDIHRSIKYGVWSGAENGNRRLDAVWRESVRTNKKGHNNGSSSSGDGSSATPNSAGATASSKQNPSATADGNPVAAAAAAASVSNSSGALDTTSGEVEGAKKTTGHGCSFV